MDLCFAMQSKTLSSQEGLQMEARQAWDAKASKFIITVWFQPTSYLVSGEDREMRIEEEENREWK